MRNCARPWPLRRTFRRTRVKCHPFIHNAFLKLRSAPTFVRKVPIFEMVTYGLYVTRIPIFKAARSRIQSVPPARFRAVLCSSSSRRLLSSACRSFIFSVATMIDGESAATPRHLYLTRENYIRYAAWYARDTADHRSHRVSSFYRNSTSLLGDSVETHLTIV